jgi:hypothetical protein
MAMTAHLNILFPPGGRLTVDGEVEQVEPNVGVTLVDVMPGDHTVEISASGSSSQQTRNGHSRCEHRGASVPAAPTGGQRRLLLQRQLLRPCSVVGRLDGRSARFAVVLDSQLATSFFIGGACSTRPRRHVAGLAQLTRREQHGCGPREGASVRHPGGGWGVGKLLIQAAEGRF